MKKFHINNVDNSLRQAIQEKIDNLNKPKGSLGMLEDLAMQICLVQHTLAPSLAHPCHLLLGGDHGIEREGVSVSPRNVTWQQMINFTKGGGGVNMFCRQHGFTLRIVDMGVDHDLSTTPGIIDHKIAWGTRNFRYEPAMSQQEFDLALQAGASLVDECHARGCNILSIGEMGIANTSPSSIFQHLLTGLPLAECVGRGSGIDDKQLRHKQQILQLSVDNFLRKASFNAGKRHDVARMAAWFGGFEMVGAIGAMLRAAELGMVFLVDGYIMSACILAASRLQPEVLSYAIFAHCGDEKAHRTMLQAMNAEPILNLRMRLGEGTGALCAYPIIVSAVRMMNEMNNFQDANIDKYF